MTEIKELYNQKEAGELLGCSVWTIRRRIKAGMLVASGIKISRAEIERYLRHSLESPAIPSQVQAPTQPNETTQNLEEQVRQEELKAKAAKASLETQKHLLEKANLEGRLMTEADLKAGIEKLADDRGKLDQNISDYRSAKAELDQHQVDKGKLAVDQKHLKEEQDRLKSAQDRLERDKKAFQAEKQAYDLMIAEANEALLTREQSIAAGEEKLRKDEDVLRMRQDRAKRRNIFTRTLGG